MLLSMACSACRHGIPVVPAFNISVTLADTHVGKAMNPEMDCLHYCSPGLPEVSYRGTAISSVHICTLPPGQSPVCTAPACGLGCCSVIIQPVSGSKQIAGVKLLKLLACHHLLADVDLQSVQHLAQVKHQAAAGRNGQCGTAGAQQVPLSLCQELHCNLQGMT